MTNRRALETLCADSWDIPTGQFTTILAVQNRIIAAKIVENICPNCGQEYESYRDGLCPDCETEEEMSALLFR